MFAINYCLKCYEEWKSSIVAEDYMEKSMTKMEDLLWICQQIISLKPKLLEAVQSSVYMNRQNKTADLFLSLLPKKIIPNDEIY